MTMSTLATIRAIAARVTYDNGTPDHIHGLPATAYHGDHGTIRIGQAGPRTIVTITRFGADTTRTFIGPTGAEAFIRSVA